MSKALELLLAAVVGVGVFFLVGIWLMNSMHSSIEKDCRAMGQTRFESVTITCAVKEPT